MLYAQEILGHVAINPMKLRIPRSKLGKFVKREGWQPTVVYDLIKRSLKATTPRVSLAGGTPHSQTAEPLFELDLNSLPDLKNLLEL
jgi:hypothetical protein